MTSPYYLNGLRQQRDELSEMLESLERRQRVRADCDELRARLGSCRQRIDETDRLIVMLEIKLLKDPVGG